MEERINVLLKDLEEAITQDNLSEIGYEITEKLEENPSAFFTVEHILKLMEKYPDKDFGAPGPLVHFVETFYRKGYEEKLVESLERCPTEHTVWMLNRIINGEKGERKEYYINVLKSILNFPRLDEGVKEVVNEFISSRQ